MAWPAGSGVATPTTTLVTHSGAVLEDAVLADAVLADAEPEDASNRALIAFPEPVTGR